MKQETNEKIQYDSTHSLFNSLRIGTDRKK